MRPGQDLVVGGFIGIEGTVYAAEHFEAYLRKTLPKSFLKTARNFRRDLEKEPGKAAAGFNGVSVEEVRTGGIFAALWRMAEQHRAGIMVELGQIPIRQETIEICEALELNPYALLSGGCALFAADNGNDVLWALKEAGVFGAVIGKVTDGRDRLILNGEIRSYLNRPAPDEMEKLKERTDRDECLFCDEYCTSGAGDAGQHGKYRPYLRGDRKPSASD